MRVDVPEWVVRIVVHIQIALNDPFHHVFPDTIRGRRSQHTLEMLAANMYGLDSLHKQTIALRCVSGLQWV